MRRAVGLLVACVLSGCVYQSLDPGSQRFLGAAWVADRQAAETVFVGLTLEETLAGSLDELDFAAGLRVTAVDPASPAEAAGIRRGDVVVAVNEAELVGLEQWSALLAAAAPGEDWRLSIEREHGLHVVSLRTRERAQGQLEAPQLYIERLKLRAKLRSVVGTQGSAVEVVARLPGSPLTEAGIEVGDRLVSLDGRPLPDAGFLAAALDGRDFGEEIELGVSGPSGVDQVSLELWSPPRHLTALWLPILFHYEDRPAEDRTRVAFLDLWLFSLFAYERQGVTRRYSILRIFGWETGSGELAELAAPEER